MIKFFRHIRQSLIIKNQTGKYLKYAIGEIILVVIGILIALQVNNWNENRKAKLRKDNLLKSLQVEFEQNLDQLDSVLYYDHLVAKSSLKFLHLQSDDDVVKEKDSMRLLLQNTSWIWTFDPLDGALRSGISSGDINLINNNRLKNLLFTWEDVVADAKENEDRALNLRINSKAIFKHVRNVDYRSTNRTEFGKSKFISDYEGLIYDPDFEDYISERYSHMRDAIIELDQVRVQNLEILDLIKHELSLTND